MNRLEAEQAWRYHAARVRALIAAGRPVNDPVRVATVRLSRHYRQLAHPTDIVTLEQQGLR